MDKREYSFYFVGTPIGNFEEMTFRAVDILKSVDEVWCEDTKHSMPLLAYYDIKKPLQSFHKYSDISKVELLLEKLQSGIKIAYISDAGMPCISDPGLILSQELIKNNIDYTVISGASACLNALILSGLNTDNFYFVGFLKDKNKEKEEQINKVKNLDCTLIFYSSVHNIEKDIFYLKEKLGDRQCAVVRELTKLYEEVVRGKFSEIEFTNIKGEYVICVQGAGEEQNTLSVEDYLKESLQYLDSKEAIKETAKKYNLQKNEVYQMYVKIKNSSNKNN